MESKMRLDKQGKDEIKSMFNWIKKLKNSDDLSNLTHNGHCNNYATNCCLSCDKCWGGKNKIQK
ncbi:hypothetical protein G9F72_011045 [Clostridium estertheticum]|uniref:hypothetical protein n=1 Tax=Clostridium estertheticum TaxID=238834 RepID=UPI0013E985E2|nr:hypothetical protein [Clostridium estertheticum]MBZ9686861.1 hypothetical protein [Clostridium estertheticum]